jgi:hypothetical protein
MSYHEEAVIKAEKLASEGQDFNLVEFMSTTPNSGSMKLLMFPQTYELVLFINPECQ